MSERRIDITIGRVRAAIEALDDEKRHEMARQPWWLHLDAALALRAMERAEEACGSTTINMADIYDRTVEPGQNGCVALPTVFAATYLKGRP